jgi:hypothetical protein
VSFPAFDYRYDAQGNISYRREMSFDLSGKPAFAPINTQDFREYDNSWELIGNAAQWSKPYGVLDAYAKLSAPIISFTVVNNLPVTALKISELFGSAYVPGVYVAETRFPLHDTVAITLSTSNEAAITAYQDKLKALGFDCHDYHSLHESQLAAPGQSLYSCSFSADGTRGYRWKSTAPQSGNDSAVAPSYTLEWFVGNNW